MAGGKSCDFVWKVVLVGDTGVGKTNLLSAFEIENFDKSFKSTIGVEFSERDMNIKGKVARVQFWDTAGQEKYRSLSAIYLRGAMGAIIVYDITVPQSFANLSTWVKLVTDNAETDVCGIIVANKTDLNKKHDFSFIETSALENNNVTEAFTILKIDMYNSCEKAREKRINNNSVRLEQKKRETSNCHC